MDPNYPAITVQVTLGQPICPDLPSHQLIKPVYALGAIIGMGDLPKVHLPHFRGLYPNNLAMAGLTSRNFP